MVKSDFQVFSGVECIGMLLKSIMCIANAIPKNIYYWLCEDVASFIWVRRISGMAETAELAETAKIKLWTA